MLAPGLAYVAFVFGTGFVLGTVRVLLVVPAVGVRAAELLELPLMVAASWLAARWMVRRFAVTGPGRALRIGLLAGAGLLATEVALGVALRGVGPWQVLTDKDPVSGPAYYASVVLFALLPWLLTGRR